MKTGILLLHGLTGVPSEMRPVEKYLQRLGFDTETPVLAGHGGTHDELLAVTGKDWIDSADEAFQRLSARVDQVLLCGLSMGASISAILSTRYKSKVRGLIMLSPTMEYDTPNDANKPLHKRWHMTKPLRRAMVQLCLAIPIVGRTFYWVETPPYGLRDERLQRQITKAIEAAKRGEDTKFGLFRTYFGSLSQMSVVTNEFRRLAGQVSCPSLVVSSMEDTIASMSNATEVYAGLGTNQKSLVMLSGCDHVLTLDLKRNYVCRLIGEFLLALGLWNGDNRTNTDSSGLTIEIHNCINPLSTSEWNTLVPGQKPITELVSVLQERNFHESHCHTLVLRHDNEPILMLPLALDKVKQVALIGIEQQNWGQMVSAKPTDLFMDGWAQVTRVATELRTSYGAGQIQYATKPEVTTNTPGVRELVASSK